jgi:NAD(P)H dehydrogenase (quinone)
MKKTSDTDSLEFCGIEVVDHVFFGAVPKVDDTTRKGMLKTLEEKLKSF